MPWTKSLWLRNSYLNLFHFFSTTLSRRASRVYLRVSHHVRVWPSKCAQIVGSLLRHRRQASPYCSTVHGKWGLEIIFVQKKIWFVQKSTTWSKKHLISTSPRNVTWKNLLIPLTGFDCNNTAYYVPGHCQGNGVFVWKEVCAQRSGCKKLHVCMYFITDTSAMQNLCKFYDCFCVECKWKFMHKLLTQLSFQTCSNLCTYYEFKQLIKWSYIIAFHFLTVCRVDSQLSIKVADFGFSRDIYNIDYYRLERRTRLPVKWLPPESLFDNIFTEKTDIVSFRFWSNNKPISFSNLTI